MVTTKNIIKYRCPHCLQLYDTIQFAQECDCNYEPIEEKRLEEYFCDICSKKHTFQIDAMDCEEKHETYKDLFWHNWKDMQEKKKLEDASKHPLQKHLNQV